MKVSLNTVKQLIDFELPPTDELVARVNSQLGGVEEIIDLTDKYKDALIVRVVECKKHENADKLSVTKIDDGGAVNDVPRDENGLVQVVCGAPNVHADMWAVWLPPSATVPASYDDAEPFVLSARELRGVLSQGMLAAADELGIGSDHDGILEINPDEWRPQTIEIRPGVSFAKAYGLDDTIIDIENKMFTHRPDLFGQLGVAREISAILKGLSTDEEDTRFVNPDWYWSMPTFAQVSKVPLEVFNESPDAVPRAMFVVMDNVEIKPSPLWLQCVLVAMGSKPINNVVDVTNYVMLMTAQPTHAYDYDKLRGAKIGARMAHDGETIKLLNGKTYELTADDIVIADAEGPVGLGGIMGGGESEVSAETTRIVLEVATFDMYTVRKSSMRHGVFTDALARFNKGQSPLQNNHVLSLLMKSVADVSPATQTSDVYDLPQNAWAGVDSMSGEIAVGVQFINDRLGSDLTLKQIGDLMRRVNIASSPSEHDDEVLLVTAPFWRTDIELPEDVVEEVGRLYGFDKLPRMLPIRSIAPAAKNEIFQLKDSIRTILSGGGANEVLTYSFVHENTLKRAGQELNEAFQLSNALSPELQYYRLSITPSLLEKIHPNIKSGHDEFALFEIGKAHEKSARDSEGLPLEFMRLSLVYARKKKDKGAPYYHAKRMLEWLLGELGVESVSFVPLQEVATDAIGVYFTPQRAAKIMAGNTFLGYIGEYTSEVQAAFKLPRSTAGFELSVEALLGVASAKQYHPLSRFPRVTQDISLKVPIATQYQDVRALALATIESEQPGMCDFKITPLSIYQADGDPEYKTITLRLTIASHEATLTDNDVNALLERVLAAAKSVYVAQRS